MGASAAAAKRAPERTKQVSASGGSVGGVGGWPGGPSERAGCAAQCPGVRLFGVAAWPAVGAFRQVLRFECSKCWGVLDVANEVPELASCGVWGDRAQRLVLEVGISPPCPCSGTQIRCAFGALGSRVGSNPPSSPTKIITPNLIQPACCPRPTCQHSCQLLDIALCPTRGNQEVFCGHGPQKSNYT